MIEEALIDQGKIITVKLPRPHQISILQDLYNASCSMDRYTCIMACGTGKTLLAMWHAEQIKAKRILILLPSLGLLNQTLGEWLKNTRIKNFKYLCVCSDQTVGTEEDLLQFMPGDLDFRVTTHPEQVSQFIKSSHSEEVTIIFSTYHSAEVISFGLKQGFKFDLVIYDEAHKTAGEVGRSFGYSLFDNNLKARKRLFLTATPRMINRNKVKSSQESLTRNYISMDNKAIYGDVVHNLNFAKSVLLDVIVDYKIVISVVTSGMVKDFLYTSNVKFKNKKMDSISVAHLLAMQHAVKEHDIKKLITFHSRVKAAESFGALISEHWLELLEDFNSFHVSGKMPANVREKNIRGFKNSNKSILTNARCLTEGVDVPAVDMVAFLCSKKSRVDIVQAVGRVMRKSFGKKQGYVLIPFYIESDIDESFLEENIKYSDYSEIFHVLRVLADYDDHLNQIISMAYEEKGENGSLRSDIFSSKISIVSPTNLDINILKNSISTLLLKNVGKKWDYYYGLLKKFKKEYGHCRVSSHEAFGDWVIKQRQYYKKGDLNSERIEKLNALGFIWDDDEAAWIQNYEELKKFKEQYGHCKVPPHSKVGHWLVTQRKLYRKNDLRYDRAEKLNILGLVWDPIEAAWEEKFSQLKRFKDMNQHLDVPANDPEYISLRGWVSSQRTYYRENRIPDDRIKKLEDLGFVWDVNNASWNKKYEELKNFKNMHGHCNVLQKNNLGVWASVQRMYYKKNQLSSDRIEKLNALGFIWDSGDFVWNEKYEELHKFKNKFGHCNVPARDNLLGVWLGTQKKSYKNNTLSVDRIEKLKSLGVAFDLQSELFWKQKYDCLKEFKNKYGHCNVSSGSEYDDLACWLINQRRCYKRDELGQHRIQALNDLGVIWSVKECLWDSKYSQLVEFQKETGHANIPTRHELGQWVADQRKKHKKSKLSTDRALKLNAINFCWDPLESSWNGRYEELVKLKKKYGHFKTPSRTILGKWIYVQKRNYKEGKMNHEHLLKLQEIGFFEKI